MGDCALLPVAVSQLSLCPIWGFGGGTDEGTGVSILPQALVRWCSSFRALFCPVVMVLALSNKHLTSPLLIWVGWSEWKSRYRSVCLGFLYTVTSRLPSSLLFTPAPTKLPLVDTVAAVEEGARQLNKEDAEDLRRRVYGILRCAKSPKDNEGALRSLENEAILPADKGNATVMMTREDYDTKMSRMLSTTTYKQLKKDLTATQEGRLSQELKELEKKGRSWGVYTIDSGHLAASLPGSTISRRSAKMASHSGWMAALKNTRGRSNQRLVTALDGMQ